MTEITTTKKMKKRNHRKIKLGVGIIIIALGINNLPASFEQAGSTPAIITGIAWIIVGIFIMIGTGRIKNYFNKNNKEKVMEENK